MAKKNKVKLPKRVAGVKLSKELRKGGEALIAQAQSPEGRAAIARGVSVVAGLAASAAKAAATKHAKSAKPAEPVTPPAPASAANDGPPAPDAVAQAVGAGIEAVLGRLFAKR